MTAQLLRKDFDRVSKRHKQCAEATDAALDRMISDLQGVADMLQKGGEGDPAVPVVVSAERVKSSAQRLLEEHKEVMQAHLKVGKFIDKNFRTDVGKVSTIARGVDVPRAPLNESIVHHLYREGRFDLGDQFAEEASVELDASIKASLQEMYLILTALQAKDTGPALQWAIKMRPRLQDQSLEFQLHKLRFLVLLQEGASSAMAYARDNFAPFADTYIREIQRLMGCFIYISRLEKSPYADLFSPQVWHDVQQTFSRLCCGLMGLPRESPHYICMCAGATAMPALLKMIKVLEISKTEWSQQNELPVEINIGQDYAYHSIFVCPVTKELATEANPAVILPCGHMLCEETVAKLSKGNAPRLLGNPNNRFKCPYCPMEATRQAVKRVFM